MKMFQLFHIKPADNMGLAQWRVKAKIKVLAFYSAKSQLY
jgi:hypothetical protein